MTVQNIISYLENTIKGHKNDNKLREETIRRDARSKDIPLDSIMNTILNINAEKEIIYTLENTLRVCKSIASEIPKLEKVE